MKRETRLYNVIFPIWILMFWPSPPVFLVTLFGNLAIDCAVVALALLALRHPAKGMVLRRCWWKVWLYGFLSDIIGALWLAAGLFGAWALGADGNAGWVSDFAMAMTVNPFRHPLAFVWTAVGVAIAGVCIGLMYLLIRSTYGRAFKAIREDEIAAEAMGVNLFRHKQMSFCISSFFAGVGGALLAMFQTTVAAAQFKSALTYEILLIVVIGGIGSVTGSCLASFLFVACSEWWLRFLDSEMVLANGLKVPFLRNGFRLVVFSIIIMIVVLFFRRGIMGDKELPDLFRRRPGKRKEAVK